MFYTVVTHKCAERGKDFENNSRLADPLTGADLGYVESVGLTNIFFVYNIY